MTSVGNYFVGAVGWPWDMKGFSPIGERGRQNINDSNDSESIVVYFFLHHMSGASVQRRIGPSWGRGGVYVRLPTCNMFVS